jgi:hypothetical protein
MCGSFDRHCLAEKVASQVLKQYGYLQEDLQALCAPENEDCEECTEWWAVTVASEDMIDLT